MRGTVAKRLRKQAVVAMKNMTRDELRPFYFALSHKSKGQTRMNPVRQIRTELKTAWNNLTAREKGAVTGDTT